jgi:hypothetical protein
MFWLLRGYPTANGTAIDLAYQSGCNPKCLQHVNDGVDAHSRHGTAERQTGYP